MTVSVMGQGETIPTREPDFAVKSGANGSGSIEGTELVDELGPIPTLFPLAALDPGAGTTAPRSPMRR